MSEKSYVTLEQHLCPACGAAHDTGALLLDRRLKDTFEMKTTTGWEICPSCKEKIDEGYVVLVECDPSKSGEPGKTLSPSNAFRTGYIAYVRLAAFEMIFTQPAPEKRVVFVEIGVIDKLKELQDQTPNDTTPSTEML